MKSNPLLDRMKKDLGTKTTEIAAKLRRRKITGAPMIGESCPLASYCTNVLGATAASVSVNVIELTFQFETPAAYAKFIDKFDRGDYPELIHKDVRQDWE